MYKLAPNIKQKRPNETDDNDIHKLGHSKKKNVSNWPRLSKNSGKSNSVTIMMSYAGAIRNR